MLCTDNWNAFQDRFCHLYIKKRAEVIRNTDKFCNFVLGKHGESGQ